MYDEGAFAEQSNSRRGQFCKIFAGLTLIFPAKRTLKITFWEPKSKSALEIILEIPLRAILGLTALALLVFDCSVWPGGCASRAQGAPCTVLCGSSRTSSSSLKTPTSMELETWNLNW